jgi:hypothetical protein
MFKALFFTSILFCILSECLVKTSDFYLPVKPFKSFIKQAIDPTKLESRLLFCDDNK